MALVQEKVIEPTGREGVTSPGTSQKTYIDAIHDTLEHELRADDGLVILGEDVGRRGGVFGVLPACSINSGRIE